MTWTTNDIPDQAGRVAIVTGSNTGLGLDTAAELAAKGATVVLACRTPSKAQAAKTEIESRTSNGSVEILELDLGSLASVRDAAVETNQRFPAIDLLINNAGVMIPPRTETADGFELQFGTNHLGHYAFTGLVLDSVLAAPDSRIVTVSSIAHKTGSMRWDDLQWKSGYRRSAAYGQSKLANLLFAFELQRRLEATDSTTISVAAHPGVSATDLARYIPGANLPGIKQVMMGLTQLVGQSSADGALPSLRAATDPAVTGGQYYGPTGRNEMAGPPDVAAPMPHALRTEDWARLWEISEDLTNVTYPI